MSDRITSDSTYLRNWARTTSPEMRKHLTLQWLSNLRFPDSENAALEFIDIPTPAMVRAARLHRVLLAPSKFHLRLVP